MGDFQDEDKQLKGQIEDIQVEIDRKERELFGFDDELSSLQRKKALLEVDIEELLKEKQKIVQDLRRLENE